MIQAVLLSQWHAPALQVLTPSRTDPEGTAPAYTASVPMPPLDHRTMIRSVQIKAGEPVRM